MTASKQSQDETASISILTLLGSPKRVEFHNRINLDN